MWHRSKMVIFLVVLIAIGATVNTGLVFALGNGATISGGENNRAEGEYATVSGGINNIADGEYATASGGFGNIASAFASTVSSGSENAAEEAEATVGGGHGNKARGGNSTIGGGESNVTTGRTSTIAGGVDNKALGFGSAVGGGSSNVAEGTSATVPGGSRNNAVGDYSFAAGRDANARHAGTFVWADTSTPNTEGTGVNSTGPNQFLIRASGGVGIGTNSPNEMLVVGEDLGRPFSGNRVTVGNKSGHSGINLGEDGSQRAFILWHDTTNHLEIGTTNQLTYPGALVVKDGKVEVKTNNPAEALSVNGNVVADAFVRRSSQRWKTDIQTITGALDTVQSLRGVSYDWKDNGRHDIGLIAEEVGRVIPEAVVYEENGQDATSVDYALLVPVLIEAIKEQQAMIEDLKAHIDQRLR
jgi:hypothetical protein